jgi:hypothetical protein
MRAAIRYRSGAIDAFMTVLGAQQGRRGLPGLASLKKVRDQDAFAVVPCATAR